VELDRNGYSCFKILPAMRALVLKKHPPKYGKLFADHVTHQFGITYAEHRENENMMQSVMSVPIESYGYLDSGDGLECWLVMVDGEKVRPDGKLYHLTWSLDPGKYKPVMSNSLIASQEYEKISMHHRLAATYTFVPNI